MATEQRPGSFGHQPRSTRGHQQRERQEGPPPGLPAGAGPADTVVADPGLRAGERMNSCCCQPPSLWPFVRGPQETR